MISLQTPESIGPYILLVRSQFEHCSTIWRPTTESEISAFDKLQKKAIKWIHGEPYPHCDNETYLQKCAQMKIIPMMALFDINDLVFFHKIVYNLVPFSLPNLYSRTQDKDGFVI